MIECKKTGAHIYLEQHARWAVCDAFILGVDAHTEEPIWCFRIVYSDTRPQRSVKHFTVLDATLWFPDAPITTLITNKATYHGYEGVNI